MILVPTPNKSLVYKAKQVYQLIPANWKKHSCAHMQRLLDSTFELHYVFGMKSCVIRNAGLGGKCVFFPQCLLTIHICLTVSDTGSLPLLISWEIQLRRCQMQSSYWCSLPKKRERVLMSNPARVSDAWAALRSVSHTHKAHSTRGSKSKLILYMLSMHLMLPMPLGYRTYSRPRR